MLIGVLALQGAFIEHINVLKSLNVDCFEIRNKEDSLKDFDGLIIPGGESTCIGKLLKELEIFDILQNKIINGLPVYGTCAGMILLAKEIENNITHLSTMNINVRRNAYGRQLSSFSTKDKFDNLLDVEMVFIRAPLIKDVSEGVEVLSIVNGNIVAAREKNQLVTSFHPELTNDYRVHKYFIEMVKESKKVNK